MATINNITSNTLVSGTSSADTITNSGSNVTITNDGGTLAVYNSGSALINGSDSNELISLGGYSGSITVDNGGGNDTIIANNRSTEVFKYVGGNLLIENYNYNDTLELVNSSLNNVTTDGGNLIFNTSKGSITLKNMANHAITIKDSKGKTSTKVYGTGYLPKDVIKNYVQSAATSVLYGSNRVDEAIRSSSHFSSLQDVIDHMVSDCRKANDAATFLRDYCGIIYDNDDVGAIIGWDNGGLDPKTSKDLMPTEGDAIYPTVKSFTTLGLTLELPDDDTLTAQERLVLQGLYSWWTEDALKLIDESYGLNFYRTQQDNYTIPFYFANDSTAFGWAWAGPSLTVNMAYTHFDEDDRTGGLLNGALVHEYTHVLQCKFNIWDGMTNYMTEGMANLTGGSDGYTALAGNADSLAAYLDVNNGFSEDGNVYTVGYLFWRYYMKQTADAYSSLDANSWSDNAVLDGTSAGELMSARGSKLTLDAGAGNDTLTVYGKNEVINAGDGDDSILVSSLSGGSTINAGAGNDSIYNRGSNVYIDAGDGNDSVYNGGTSVAINTGTGDDTIFNSISTVTINAGAGADSIELYGSSKVSVDSGDGNDVIISGQYFSRGATKSTLKASDGDDTIISHGSNSSLSAGAGNDVIANGYYYYAPWDTFYSDNSDGDASLTDFNGSNVYIEGGDGNDSINNRGSNVTIDAGAGNDTIDTGWGKKEVIIYVDGDGNDLIRNFDSSDVIRIAANSISTQISGYDYIIDVYGRNVGSITLEGAAGNVTGANIILNKQNDISVIKNSKNGVTVKGSSGADSIVSSGSKVTIVPGAGNDTVTGSKNADVLLVSPTDGKDLVTNFGAKDTLRAASGTLKAGVSGSNYVVTISGDDSTAVVTLKGSASNVLSVKGSNAVLTSGKRIVSSKNATLLSGSNYADSILASGKSVTINAGKGNDTITGSKNADVILYGEGDGKDVITNFGAKDSLRVTSGSIKNYYASGKDYVINVSGTKSSGSITLKNVVDNYSLKQSGSTITLTNKKSSAQLPSDEYWFAEDSPSEENELNEIISTNDNSIDLPTELDSDPLKRSTNELLTTSTRHRRKKIQ